MTTFKSTSNIDGTLKNIVTIITEAAERAIGKTSYIKQRNPVPWWNHECKTAVESSKRAFNKYKRYKTLENKIEYTKQRAIAKKTTRNAKRQSWTQYVSTLNANTPMTEVWNKVRRISGLNSNQNIKSLERNGKAVTSNTEIAKILANTYKNRSSNINYKKSFINYKQHEENKKISITPNTDEPLNLPISQLEYTEALSNIKETSAGPDDIPSIFIKHLPASAHKQLLDLFNIIWLQHKFPEKWHESIVIPIQKPNSIKTSPESYRPISLTCAMCKLLEKIINNRLRWHLERQDLIIPEQSGFRDQRSTIDNIIDLESDISEAFALGGKCLAVFFDISRAFDTAWHDYIIKKLHSWNIQGHSLFFIKNFLQNRTFRVRTNNITSDIMYPENGIPQGSVISPTLFIVAINDILKNLKSPVKARVYADDLVVFCKGKNIQNIFRHTQNFIQDLEIWSQKTGFCFSAEKTRFILFSKRNVTNIPNLRLCDENLKRATSIKFLGMTFEETLSWKLHITNLMLSCHKRLNLLKTLANKEWGADRQTLLMLYRTLIRSKLDYGSTVYSTAAKTLLKKLDSLHNLALRIISGAFRTTPIESLYCEVGEPSLEDRRVYLSVAYAAKIRCNSKNPTIQNCFTEKFPNLFINKPRTAKPFYARIRSYLNQINYAFPECFPSKLSSIPPWQIKNPQCLTHLISFDKHSTNPQLIKSAFNDILRNYKEYTQVYTDASKSNEGTGAAVITPTSTNKYKLPSEYSIYSAELYALYQATLAVNASSNTKYIILTDSLSSVQSIQYVYPSNPLVIKIKQEVHTAQLNGKIIIFLWIPSHIGIQGNEEADNAAKEAATSDSAECTETFTSADVKAAVKRKVRYMWEEKWKVSSAKLREIKKSIKPWPTLPTSRRDQVILTRLRLGHTRLTNSHVFSDKQEPRCDNCEEKLTIKHLLENCAALTPKRILYNIPNKLSDILGLQCNMSNLKRFLSAINILYNI